MRILTYILEHLHVYLIVNNLVLRIGQDTAIFLGFVGLGAKLMFQGRLQVIQELLWRLK